MTPSRRALLTAALPVFTLLACTKRDDPSVVRGPVQANASLCPQTQAPRAVGTLANGSLVEVSGLTASSTHERAFYTHNDSGDAARVFALADDGTLRAELALEGATATDIEDIATGPCGSARCVFVADMGDNGATRSEVAIYRFVEPPELVSSRVAVATIRFRYEDGPHNAESLLVDPRDGALYVITKEKTGASSLFAVPPDGGIATRRARLAPPLGSNLFTGASFAPAGDRVALRTYTHAFVYPVLGPEALAAALERPPCVVAAPDEPQGEAIAFTRDGLALRFASEGKNVPFYEVALAPPAP